MSTMIALLLFVIGMMLAFSTNKGAFMALMLTILICGTFTYYLTHDPQKQQPSDDLPKPPNYDKEALLDLMEKGECVGGTIDEGKFSVFVCKE